ncbi:hypothetical protein OMEGA_68 [Klebsiella phage vB_KaeM_KaOmega]|nr:hypothetical protein OMEGA_68 [Klebsiella phage vB_KaeM_KaOmega]
MQEILLAAGASGGVKGDKTLLLLQADKGGIDVANPSRPFTRTATVAAGSYGKFNNKYFDCTTSTSYFEMDGTVKNDLVFKPTDDFTIEFWSRNTSVASSWWMYFGTGTQSCLKVYQNIVYLQDQLRYLSFSSNLWPLSNWAHVAIVSKSGTTKLYINGVSIGTPFASGGWSTFDRFSRIGFGEQTMFGALDQFRISKVARYDGNFSVPTAPFVLD